jgi:hypothetical protein
MDLDTLSKQLKSTESQLSAYGANLPSEIEGQIQKAYTPALQQSLGVTRDLMGDYLGRYFETTGMGPGMAGTTARDLSPTQKLGVMGRELGTMVGDLQYSQKLSDYLGGQMTDMYGKALQAAQMGQQNLADQYARTWQQYQLAWQEAEAEKNRRLQERLSGGGGGGGGNIYVPTPVDSEGTDDQQVDDITITVPEGNKNNWTNLYSANRAGDTSKWLMNNPVATAGTLLGNLLGNRGTDKTFWQKLFNQ